MHADATCASASVSKTNNQSSTYWIKSYLQTSLKYRLSCLINFVKTKGADERPKGNADHS